MGGKSSKTVVGYKYYVGFQMILARCIHRILTLTVDNNQAWAGVQTGSGVIDVNAPDLFGGDKGTDPEGGVVGSVSFQQGLDSQDPDPYLQSKLGADIPASRLVSGLVARQIYSGNSPYLKQWTVTAERIHIDDDGNTQWYDAKSEIIISAGISDQLGPTSSGWKYKQVASSDSADYSDPAFDDSTWATGQSPFASAAGHPFAADGGFPAIMNTHWDTNTNIWCRRHFTIHDTNQFGLIVFADNFATVWVNGQLVLPRVGSGTDASAESFMHEVSIPASFLTVGDNMLVVKAEDTGTISYVAFKLDASTAPMSDMNATHMIRECLINGEWGYGYDESDVDDTNFKATADTLYDEGMGLSYFWDDDQTDIDDVLKKFEDTVDCAIYVDRSTLKWTIKLVRDDYDPSTLPVFTMDEEILEVDSFNRPAFMDLMNTEQISYSSNLGSTNPTITIPNPALLLQQGVTKTVQTTYDMVCNGFLASRLASRDLLADSSPLASGTVYLNYTSNTKTLHRGAVCKLTMPLHNMNQTVVRVTDISFGDGTTKKIKMSFLEDKFSLSSGAVIPPITGSQPGSGSIAAQPVSYQQAMEVPYYLLVQQQGQQTIDQQIADDPDSGIFGIAAARPTGGLSADIYVDSGSGYVDSAKCDFCPYGKLSIDLPLPGLAGSNTFTLTGFEDLDELETNHILLIGNEFVSGVHAGNGVFTSVVRACLDSVPQAHVAGAAVLGVMNYLDSDEKDYAGGETVNLKLLTNSTGPTLLLGAAPVASVTIAGRAAKPYPPANVKIGGAYYPSTASGTFTVAWASRNRVQQTTTGVPIGFLDGNVTPAPNTRYSMAFYDSTNTLIVQRDNIGPATASVALAVSQTVRMDIWTVDDIGASTYKFSTTFAYTHTGAVNTITATDYVPVDTSTIIDGGQI